MGGTETEAVAEDPAQTAPGSWFRCAKFGMRMSWRSLLASSFCMPPCTPGAPTHACRLHGYKWFTSAADGEISMALAQERPAGGGADSGSSGRGLTLFLVPVTRDAEGRPQVGQAEAAGGRLEEV